MSRINGLTFMLNSFTEYIDFDYIESKYIYIDFIYCKLSFYSRIKISKS